MAEQPKTSQPAAEQRRRLFGRGRRRRSGGGRGGSSGGGGLLGPSFLVRDGGAVVQVSVDEALAPSDVVDAADGRVSSVRQRETRLLLRDGADPLVTQIPVQDVVACSGDDTSQHQCGNQHPLPVNLLFMGQICQLLCASLHFEQRFHRIFAFVFERRSL